uniref:CBFD_NFYB_HMF domain-containing protein n=1 Tax=Caenorhabditis tropicalis TaxID=1561998 RepID=A0A1I7TTW0_9PELO
MTAQNGQPQVSALPPTAFPFPASIDPAAAPTQLHAVPAAGQASGQPQVPALWPILFPFPAPTDPAAAPAPFEESPAPGQAPDSSQETSSPAPGPADPFQNVRDTPPFPMLPPPENKGPIVRARIGKNFHDPKVLLEAAEIYIAHFTEILRQAVATRNYIPAFSKVVEELHPMPVELQGPVSVFIFNMAGFLI